LNDIQQKFVWLNPIVEKMVAADRDRVAHILGKKGYTVVSCESGAKKIREAYHRYIQRGVTLPAIDARCPKVVALIKEKYPTLCSYIAPIPPILVACAEDLFSKYIEANSERATLTIVAPCIALVRYGESVFGNDIRFVTWKQFEREIDFVKQYPKLDASPVPPGFFKNLENQVAEANGSEAIEKLLVTVSSGELSPSVNLLELLHCDGGCHNGDGL
jgi:iron only hydrogenase large subunit-like protein